MPRSRVVANDGLLAADIRRRVFALQQFRRQPPPGRAVALLRLAFVLSNNYTVKNDASEAALLIFTHGNSSGDAAQLISPGNPPPAIAPAVQGRAPYRRTVLLRTSKRRRPTPNGAHGFAFDRSGALYLAEGRPSRLTRFAPVLE